MMKKIILLATMLGSSLAAISQTHVKQYLYTAGGSFGSAGNKVKVAVLKGNVDKSIDSLKGDFSNAVNVYYDKANLRYEGLVHIGRSVGNEVIVRYDLDTYKMIDSVSSKGVTAFARTKDFVVVAKGYGSTGTKVDILNASNLRLTKEVTGIANNCTDVKVYGDTAFVTHSLPSKKQSWVDSVGYLSLISISQGTLLKTISLGTEGKGAKNLIIRKEDDTKLHIYYSNFGIGTYQTVDNMTIHSIVSSQTVAVTDKKIFGIQKTNPYLTAIDINKFSNDTAKHATNVAQEFVECAYDTASNLYLILKTDYFSYGKLIRYSVAENKAIDSTNLGISATAIAIDYRPGVITSLAKDESSSNVAFVYPNPCKDVLTINNLQNATSYSIQSQLGQTVLAGSLNNSEEKITTEELAKGVYFLVLSGNASQKTIKFVKE